MDIRHLPICQLIQKILLEYPSIAKYELEIVLSEIIKIPRSALFLHMQQFLSNEQYEHFQAIVFRLSHHEPLAYILGNVQFSDCTIEVNRHVLIPRQETEIMVSEICKKIERFNRENKVVWDICTGSGCIAIALKKKFPDIHVIASDISNDALQVAQSNAKLNNVAIEFRVGSLFEPYQNEQADFIVSNPPYISETEYTTLDASVKNFEPIEALVSSGNGLFHIKELIRQLPAKLKANGCFWLEMGALQKGSIIDISKQYCPTINIAVFKDFAGHDRYIEATFA